MHIPFALAQTGTKLSQVSQMSASTISRLRCEIMVFAYLSF
eukprot:COSAG06_NODE_48829_length_329_cov_0.895652_2_plen_40_part_01